MNSMYDYKHSLDGCIFVKSDYSQFLKQVPTLSDRLKYGFNRATLFGKLRDPGFLNQLYLERDPDYFKYLEYFRYHFKDCDVIVMDPGVDLVHPEFLHQHFPKALKLIRFIDDPHMTYSYYLPFSWAFDGALYVSPSYSSQFGMEAFLKKVGFKFSYWLPHCISNLAESKPNAENLNSFVADRDGPAVYVGGYYKTKAERLLYLKKMLHSNFDIYGRFPLRGLPFCISACQKIGKPVLVKEVSDRKRNEIYSNARVGINMHLSTPSIETGNARLYELPFWGVAQIADVSDVSDTGKIFEDGKDILLYRSLKECVDLTKMLLSDSKLRTSIALEGYLTAHAKYSYDYVMKQLVGFLREKLENDKL
ncbi:glycosyltransferase [Alphaproteobacteria bacterium]|nr:glycosyltransferase [Alphaproteobacteria bacterium]